MTNSEEYMSGKNGFVKIASVLVNQEIFTRLYTCDVEGYGCKSQCCYRSCIVPEKEARKVEEHLDGILEYLSSENREALKKNGSLLGFCTKQCPAGCVIHKDEAQAIKRNFGGSDFRCVLLFNNNCALLYTNRQGLHYCAVHSYAMEKDMVWEEFKFADCVQYPLSFYTSEDGTQVLSIQDTPYLNHIPCMKNPKGEPMYKSLKKTIETFMGRDFYRELEAYAGKMAKK
jgi:hypothetical protein